MTAVAKHVWGPVDPDLEQALPALVGKVIRLRQLEAIEAHPDRSYSQTMARRTERSGLRADFAAAAAKLNIPGDQPGRTMFAIASQAERLARAMRPRKPTLAQIMAALRTVADDADEFAARARTDLAEARAIHKEASAKAEAINAAHVYLLACMPEPGRG